MSFEDNILIKSNLVVCGQLLGIYDSKKTLWTIEQLYQKIFDDFRLNQNRLSLKRFVKDVNWIIGHHLISFQDLKVQPLSNK
ncbi:hypothetical protein NMY3_03065 [Candidatus Nitrosocosmicus oleophilus]|uniref:Uncharacterized protein n=1 Tax=Candidatus Nitrosocosmicus oleophilus TaxID=1353260 RepID=A0A654MCQ2_9ARCH|nr:hypothetical protein [Candidatus Nitrosocosmicus oleophilus]ALI37252.1 hypothetical protein NMY3_03065 [Candidatus Nitrosocosmicus oleophilus]